MWGTAGELGVAPGDDVTALDGVKVGRVSSVSYKDDGGLVGLAVVRTRGEELGGMGVLVGGVEATLKLMQYATYEVASEKLPSGKTAEEEAEEDA